MTELKRAEMLLYEWSQKEMDMKKIDKRLIVKEDDRGIFRAFGRLEKIRNLPIDLRNPIVWPRDHPFVVMLLKHIH